MFPGFDTDPSVPKDDKKIGRFDSRKKNSNFLKNWSSNNIWRSPYALTHAVYVSTGSNPIL